MPYLDYTPLIDLVILGLGTWRLSSLLVNEDGPWQMLGRFRSAIGVRYNKRSEAYATTVLGELFLCVWCLSLWVSLALILAYSLTSRWTILIMSPFALSATAVIIERAVNGESKH